MAGKGDIRAGGAFVELFIKGTQFEKGLKAFSLQLASFNAHARTLGKQLVSLGADAAEAFGGAVKHFVSAGDALSKMSERTGASVTALSELGYAAEQSGAEVEDLETGLRHMQKTVAAFAGGGKEAVKLLHSLGITLDNLKEPPDAQLELFAQRIAAIRNPAERTAAALALFGKTGTKLLPMLIGGADGIRKLRDEARQLGLSISPEDAEAATRLGDAFDRIKKVFLVSKFNIGAALAEPLEKLADIITQVSSRVGAWIKENREMFRVAALASGAITALGGALVGISLMFSGASIAFAGLGAAIGTISAAVVSLVSVALTPMGIAVAVVASGIWIFRDAIMSVSSLIGSVFAPELQMISEGIGTIVTDFQSASGDIITAWDGIVDAIKAGDLVLAAQIAWTGLEVVWRKGTQSINAMWLDAKFFALSTWTEFKFAAAEIFVVLFSEVEAAWVNTVSFLESVWGTVTTKMANAWQSAQLGVGNVLINAAEKAGIVTKDFADAWRQSLSQPIEQDIGQRTAKNQQKQADIEETRKQRLSEIRGEAGASLDSLMKDRDRALAGLKSNDAAERDSAAKALLDAEQKLAALRNRAKVERSATERKKPDKELGDVEFGTRKPNVSVSFSAAALMAQGMGGGGSPMEKKMDEQLAKDDEQIKELKNINKLLAKGGVLRFG